MQVHQTLELALSLLDKNPISRRYMCCHLEWMWTSDYITEDEMVAAKAVIRANIGNHVTLAQYLRSTGGMPKGFSVHSPEYRHHQLTFYRGLISKLQSIKE